MDSNEQPVMRSRDVASFLQLSVRSVERLIKTGDLRAVRIGGARRILRDDLNAFLTKT